MKSRPDSYVRICLVQRHLWLRVVAIGIVLVGSSVVAHAATFTVTNTADSGAGSLRDAIAQANGAVGPDEIEFQAGLTGTISLTTGQIVISDDVTITGPGPRVLSVSGGTVSQILRVTAPGGATISGLRMADGRANAGGILGNTGAGIQFDSSGLLTILDCHFDNNFSDSEGGGIVLLQGSLLAERCTFTACRSQISGGGIWFGRGPGAPTVTVTNCTFFNNMSGSGGGAIRQFNTTVYTSAFTNCTFSTNTAAFGGAISIAGGTMTLRNNVFADNDATNPGDHVNGTITSLGNNCIPHTDGATIAPAAGDIFGTLGTPVDPGLVIGAPSDNGGITDTIPLQATSVCIDAGASMGAPIGDQRNLPRVGCAPDIGAFEVQTPTDTDGDGVIDCLDQCVNTPACALVNEQGCPVDGDADGVFDGCDACPGTMAGDPVDANGCSTADEDGDGVLNDADLCRGTPACAIANVGLDGCPADGDGDGLFDGCDQCPGANDLTDTDADGIPDCLDACPAVGDADGDGVQDCQDGCPADPLKLNPGACGCGNVDTDTDADGVADCQDDCPNDALKLSPGACGCGNADTDTDADGVANCLDACPTDPLKLNPGACGCGNADTDTDADGVADCDDGCPTDPNKRDAGACGCGNSDVDTNTNGIPDCLDALVPAPAPAADDPRIQVFIPLSPLVPGGLACGIGLAGPMLVMMMAFLVFGGTVCRRRRLTGRQER